MKMPAKFRMIHVDHYMSRPIAPFDDLKSEITGRPTSKVPVIRIFGADEDGRKICLHVHGFYPYVAIQNKWPGEPDFAKKLTDEIEKALDDYVAENRSRNQQPRNPEGENSSLVVNNTDSNDADAILAQRLQAERYAPMHLSADQKSPLHRIESVKTINYYGYHKDDEDFYKLHLYNPKMVKQLALMFGEGRVFCRFIPVFWAHLPYILLFFIDNNLRGMQFIELEQLYWRVNKAPKDQTTDVHSPSFYGTDGQPSAGPSSSRPSSTAPGQVANQLISDIDPISTCELEADVRFEWIINKQRFGSKGNDDALRELWLDDQEATQASAFADQKLPLHSLERSYIEQLCDTFNINEQNLDLEIEPRPERPLAIEDDFSDSEGSFDELGRDNEERSFLSPESEIKTEPLTQPRVGPALVQPKLEPKLEPMTSTQLPLELVPVQAKMESCEDDEDQFSDDDELLLAALSKIESSVEAVGRDSLSDRKREKRPFSDNSMIDGRSVICSTANQTRSGSQHSLGSNREVVSHEYQFLCLMSMELHITTREKLRPDPVFDPIEAVFYCIRNDIQETSNKPAQVVGLIITDPFNSYNDLLASSSVASPSNRSNISMAQKIRTLLHKTGLSLNDIELNIVDTELELIMTLVEVVKAHDPEILLGYEMEQLSWGYVLERSTVLDINIALGLSRITENNLGNNSKYVESSFVQPIMFTGRMVFSTWRIIRHDVNLNTCSFERIHHHALNERVPCFSFETLTSWFNQNRNRWRVIDYYLIRVVGQMRILDKFDLIAKVSELARVYGTQFIDVITRGSQIGIESMMLRLAKLQNLTPLSPTVMQRNKMKAPEALPLVMEPETNIYYDPVAVLDFQSLYPSVVIAYNYCYSTCLGQVMDLETKERHQFGCSQLHVEEDEMKRLLASNSVHVSPCGVAFVKKSVRHGILPKMLNELIVTRALVKDQMKKNMKSERPNRRLQRILDHRQHGLKMMANTTYGYTGASYTGRMPCVEIADSIVSKGRETLENAIEIVESRADWNAKVIYGDTDSIFIQFQNCDKDTAFKRSYEMVDAITQANPHPIKMKFEKIYQPCVLQTKKRYCGFKYESPEQVKPEFEAKGIETVRRDCCPAAARMLEMALRIQFTTRDVEQVRKYCQHQFVKIMSGKLSNLQDFIFARQYKPRRMDKTESVFVPAWQITKRLLTTDPRAEPRLNERFPFVIIYGEPGTPLVNLAKTPLEVLENLSFRINADYYIQKIICPTLNRIFCTMNVDTLMWYKSMPHHNIVHRSHYLAAQKDLQHFGGIMNQQATMSQYFSPSQCPVCAKSIPVSDDICDVCREDVQASVIRLTEEIARNQRKLFAYHQLCRACSSLERFDSDDRDHHHNPCISYDCQNLFRYHQAKLDALNSNYLSMILKNIA